MNKPKTRVVRRVRRETVYVARRSARVYYRQLEAAMTTEEWAQVSRTIDFILQQPTGAQQAIKGEPEKPRRRPKKQKSKVQPAAEQLRMF